MFNRILGLPTASRSARRIKRTPSVEVLEGRQLLSLGPQFQIDSGSNAQKGGVVTASSYNGSSVAVWVERAVINNGSGLGPEYIRAQYFNAAGAKVGSGVTISGSGFESEPAVAMDGLGDFVISWTAPGLNGDSYVLAQKFNASSRPVTSIIPVGVGTF